MTSRSRWQFRSVMSFAALVVGSGVLAVPGPWSPAVSAALPAAGACVTGDVPGKVLASGTTVTGQRCESNRYLSLRRVLANGSIDTTYGSSGRALLDLGAAQTFAPLWVVQADGRVVVLSRNGSNYQLRRFNAAGQIESGFGSSGVASFPQALAATQVETDDAGRIVVTLPYLDSTGIVYVRFTAAGVLDTSFDGDGTSFRDGWRPVASRLLADGRIVWVGQLIGAPIAGVGVERVKVDGTPDAGAFGTFPEGYSFRYTSTTDTAVAVATIEPSGRATIFRRTSNGNVLFEIVRFRADGQPDTAFGGFGTGTSGFIDPNSNFEDPDGPVIAPNGDIIHWNHLRLQPRIARFPAVGKPVDDFSPAEDPFVFVDADFSPRIAGGTYAVLGIDSSYRIVHIASKVAADQSSTLIGFNRVVVASDGRMSIDTSFGNGGYHWVRIPGAVTAPKGQVLADGRVRLDTDPIVQLTSSGQMDASFGTGGCAPLESTVACVGSPTGMFLLGATGLDGSVRLDWQPPTLGAPFTDYDMQYQVDNGNLVAPGPWTTFAHVPTTALTATVGGLANGTRYRFRIAAVNSVGTGAYSIPSFAQPAAPNLFALQTAPYTMEVQPYDPLTGLLKVIAAKPSPYEPSGSTAYIPGENVVLTIEVSYVFTTPTAGLRTETVAKGTPQVIGTFLADAQGTLQADVHLPALADGGYTIGAIGTQSGRGARATIQVRGGGIQAVPLSFNPLTPIRLFDTRPTEPQGAVSISQQRYGGGTVLQVKVAGVAGVPATGAGAVSLNVTAIDPLAPGFVTVYPCGTRPLASNLNYVTGQIVPNSVIAPLSPDGSVCFYSQADTHLIADVNGWFTNAGGFTATSPVRVFDTRASEPQGAVTVVKQRYGGLNVLKVKVVGIAGVPTTGVGAVSLNVTAIGPIGPGFVTVFPCGDLPLASNLNYVAGQIVPNAALAPLSADGTVCFFSQADTDLVADINGWFGAGQGFEPMSPLRLADTRPAEPQGAVVVTKQRYGAGTVLRLKVTGVADVPAKNVGAVSLNVTAIDPVGDGYVTVFPCGDRPLASNLNYVAGQVVPNSVITRVSPQGEVCLYSLDDTHLVADINGWFPS